MRGFRNSRHDRLIQGIVITLIALVVGGCGSAPETAQTAPPENEAAAFLLKYEKTFRPSDYNPDPAAISGKESALFESLHSSSMMVTAMPETIPGFRVQAFLSQDFDTAGTIRDTLASLFPDEQVYTIYDSPYYKVRLGNCPDRSSAGVLLKRISSLGYKDAWIVPDKIIKNPPPRLPDRPIEPANPLEHRR